jgi:transposase
MPKPLLPEGLWERVEPLLPRPKRRNRHVQYAGRRPSDPRKILAGILFALRTGIPWEYLPATSEFPSGYTCRRALIRWHRRGVWKKLYLNLLAELEDQGHINWSRAVVDSASVRATHGGRKTGPSPTDRRKPGSKHHLLVDAQGLPLAVKLTKANRNDITQLLPLVEAIPQLKRRRGRPRPQPRQLQADRGYDSEPHRKVLRKRGSSR